GPRLPVKRVEEHVAQLGRVPFLVGVLDGDRDVPVAPHREAAGVDLEYRPRRDGVNALEARLAGLRPLSALQDLNGIAVRPCGHRVECEQRLVFTRKQKASGAVDREVQGAVADTVACEQQRALTAAPPRDGKRSGEQRERVGPFALEQAGQQKRVAAGIQVGSQRAGAAARRERPAVVDRAVEEQRSVRRQRVQLAALHAEPDSRRRGPMSAEHAAVCQPPGHRFELGAVGVADYAVDGSHRSAVQGYGALAGAAAGSGRYPSARYQLAVRARPSRRSMSGLYWRSRFALRMSNARFCRYQSTRRGKIGGVIPNGLQIVSQTCPATMSGANG